MNIIADDFVHGENFEIGQFCIIEPGVVVGDNVRLANRVELRASTVIGDNCFIDSGVISSGGVTIGSNVTIRYNTIIAKRVTIEDGVFLAPNVMTEFSKASGEECRHIRIGRNVFIGTGSVVSPGVTISDNCIIGELSLVKRDCLVAGVYVGVPARRLEKASRNQPFVTPFFPPPFQNTINAKTP